MSVKQYLPKIAILAFAGFAIYKLKDKIKALQNDINHVSNDLLEYQNDQLYESQAPAEKYLKIFPYVEFSEITGNEWVGIARIDITNTSSNYTFNIVKLKANLSICGYMSTFMPGYRESVIRIQPGKTVTIRATWQDKRWYPAGDTTAKDTIREYLRADEHYDKWNRCLSSDVKLWITDPGTASENTYSFNNRQGDVKLDSGAKKFFGNFGENAAEWEE